MFICFAFCTALQGMDSGQDIGIMGYLHLRGVEMDDDTHQGDGPWMM
jgi:hypothetical protein